MGRWVPAVGLAVAMLSVGTASVGHAQLITNGFTFAVADNCDGIGGHFHSSTGGDFGNPSGKAEVGAFSCEEVRGLSEYDLSGLGNSASAFVTFNVFKAGGLFDGTNNFPFNGAINLFAYQGNNEEDVSDFNIASAASIGSFNTGGLVVGNVLSFNITSIFNDAIDASWSSLGIRLQVDNYDDTQGGAWTFDTFRLTTDDQSTVVPEPATLALVGAGLLLLAARRRQHRV